jgi:small-conductance mechanosensitive channel
VAIVFALDQLGITAFVLYIIIGLLALVIAAAFVLSIKDFIPNFIAGWRLSRKKLFAVGDTVTIGSVTGKVKEAGLLETKLQSRKDVIHIPNSILFKQEIRVRKR